MPISPRPPSGGGRPWSSTAIPPAYRRNRIANGERAIPLLTTRGYPLVLGDKMPIRPLSCTPSQQATPVLAPSRPVSAASVPMKATIKENTFNELVSYWEKTTLEKAKTPSFSSGKPAIKGTTLLGKPYNLEKPGGSENCENDTYSEPDHPHECGSLSLPAIDLQLVISPDTPDQFPEADNFHRPENGGISNLGIILEAKKLHVSTNNADVPDIMPEADSHLPENLGITDIEVIMAAMRANTKISLPERDSTHTGLARNISITDRDATAPTKLMAADIDNIPKADSPYKEKNLPLTDQDAIIRAKLLADDIQRADENQKADSQHTEENLPLPDQDAIAQEKRLEDDTKRAYKNPEVDSPHKDENLPLPHQDSIAKPLAANIEIPESYESVKSPQKPDNAPLLDKGPIMCKTTPDLDTFDGFLEADVPHEPGKIPSIDKGVNMRKTTAHMGTFDSFPEADVPHPPRNFNPPDVHVNAILNGKLLRTANEEIPDNLTEADSPNTADTFPCPDVDLLMKKFINVRANADHVGISPNEAQMQNIDRNVYRNDLTISGKGFPFPENIEIDCRRARTLDQHLATMKQKVLASTAHADVEKLNELQKRMHNIHTILKEISEKAKFANKEMVDIESSSLLIVSKIETRKCIDKTEKEPPSNFQTQTILPPIPTRAKHPTAEMAAKKHLNDQANNYNTPSSQIIKFSSLPPQTQTKTKRLPCIVPQTGKMHPKAHIYEPTGTPPQQAGRRTPEAYQLKRLAGSYSSSRGNGILETKQPVNRLDAELRPSTSRGPVVNTKHIYNQCRQGTDISNEYKQLQRVIDRVGRNPEPTTLQAHISHREPEPGRPMRRPRNEKQDHAPCRKRSNEGKSRSEASMKEKPNQRKPKNKQQKKKKIEKAPIKIEDRPPFLSDIKPSKYFSDVSRLEDNP